MALPPPATSDPTGKSEQQPGPELEQKVRLSPVVTFSEGNTLALSQVSDLISLGIANRASALRALQAACGNMHSAANMLMNSDCSVQEDEAPAADAPKGYYANVVTGKTSLTLPVCPAASVSSAADAPASLSEATSEYVAKCVERIGPDFKPFADQMSRYRG
jgi:hypothetical protein